MARRNKEDAFGRVSDPKIRRENLTLEILEKLSDETLDEICPDGVERRDADGRIIYNTEVHGLLFRLNYQEKRLLALIKLYDDKISSFRLWEKEELLPELRRITREDDCLALRRAGLSKPGSQIEEETNEMKSKRQRIDLGRTKLDDIAQYLLAKRALEFFYDLKDAGEWAARNLRSKGKSVNFNSIYKRLIVLTGDEKMTLARAREIMETFEKKFGIK